MHFSEIYLLLAAAAVASAAPGNPIVPIANAAECKAVNDIIKELHVNPTATKFCSSVLSIPTHTSTTTKSTTHIIPTVTTSYVATTTLTSGSISTSLTTLPITSYTSTTTVVIPTETTITVDPTTVSTCTANSTPVTPSKREEGDNLLQARTNNKPSPFPTPACLTKYKPSQISTACKCLGISTPISTTTVTHTIKSTSTSVVSLTSTTHTTVVTSVSTSTVLQTTNLISTTTTTSTSTSTYTPTVIVENCPAPTACNNQGLQWAVYPNLDGANHIHGYPNFFPEHVKQTTPEYTGTTSSLGGFDYAATSQGIDVYGQYTVNSDYFVLNHRGYIYAQQTGTYTFNVGSVDDAVCAWVGASAYTGWIRSNDQLDAAIFIPYPTYTVDLVAGQYYPIRIVFGQAQGAASFEMSVTAPDGTTFLGGSTDASPYLVQFSCDGVSAPAYAPFGQES